MDQNLFNVSDRAGVSSMQLDTALEAKGKRIISPTHNGEIPMGVAGSTSKKIAERQCSSTKRALYGVKNLSDFLAWPQCSATTTTAAATQTDCSELASNTTPAARPAGKHSSETQKRQPLRRQAMSEGGVNCFATRWKADPVTGTIGLYVQRKPGHATLQTNPQDIDMLKTYQREKRTVTADNGEWQLAENSVNVIGVTPRFDNPAIPCEAI